MPKRAQKPNPDAGQLEPLLKAFMLKRLQQDPGGPGKPAKGAKPRSKKRRKA